VRRPQDEPSAGFSPANQTLKVLDYAQVDQGGLIQSAHQQKKISS
jgi:hypothetical protein